MVGAVLWVGCGGDGEEEPADSQPAAAESQPAATETPATSGGPVDAAMAATGEGLFTSKGCTACHTIGSGRLVGPDLAGVTQRRTDAFIMGIIMNPDSMLANDADAKQLLAEYYTPMTNQGISAEDSEALLAFLKGKDAE
jgi:mono/diheme cytochrome c family protein